MKQFKYLFFLLIIASVFAFLPPASNAAAYPDCYSPTTGDPNAPGYTAGRVRFYGYGDQDIFGHKGAAEVGSYTFSRSITPYNAFLEGVSFETGDGDCTLQCDHPYTEEMLDECEFTNTLGSGENAKSFMMVGIETDVMDAEGNIMTVSPNWWYGGQGPDDKPFPLGYGHSYLGYSYGERSSSPWDPKGGPYYTDAPGYFSYDPWRLFQPNARGILYSNYDDNNFAPVSRDEEIARENAILEEIGEIHTMLLMARDNHGHNTGYMSVPVEDCVPVSGTGSRKVVIMRGDSWKVSAGEFMVQAMDIVTQGFGGIEPFSSYKDQFSFYVDLRPFPDLPTSPEYYQNDFEVNISKHTFKNVPNLKRISNCQFSASKTGRQDIDSPTTYIFLHGNPLLPTAFGYPYDHESFINFAPTPNFSNFELQAYTNQGWDSQIERLAETVIMGTVGTNFAGLMPEAYTPSSGASLSIQKSNCSIAPATDYRNINDNYVYGSVTNQGCSYNYDASGQTLWRPSATSIMAYSPGTDLSEEGKSEEEIARIQDFYKFNVVSCGYIVGAIQNRMWVTKDVAQLYWPECYAKGDALALGGLPERNPAPTIYASGQTGSIFSTIKTFTVRGFRNTLSHLTGALSLALGQIAGNPTPAPHIGSADLTGVAGSPFTLHGTDFTATGNSVQFLDEASGYILSDITGLSSADGGSVSFTVPELPSGFYKIRAGAFNSDWSNVLSFQITGSGQNPISVSCQGVPTTVVVGQSVVWRASASGGSGMYTYSWSGSENLSGTDSTVGKLYNTGGAKTATITATDSLGGVAEANCFVLAASPSSGDWIEAMPVSVRVLSYSIVSNPAHGTLTGTAPDLTYEPNLNFTGSDSFTFKVTEGAVSSKPATVSITVLNGVTTTAQKVTAYKNTAKVVTLPDKDSQGSQYLTYSIVSNPAHGTLTGTAPNLTYTPVNNFIGTDSFLFNGTTDKGNSANARVVVIVLDQGLAGVSQDVVLQKNSAPQAITLTATEPDWQKRGSDQKWHTLATNISGQYSIAGVYDGRLYVSPDYGADWIEAKPAGDKDQSWITAAVSDDGTHMIVGSYKKGTYNIGQGRLYVSSNRGLSWKEVRPIGDTDQLWHTVSISPDGTHLIAGINKGTIYTSSDFGANWTPIKPGGFANGYWLSSAISSDGNYMLAASFKGSVIYANGIYVTTNKGDTWRNIQPAGDIANNWIVAASTDGVHLIAASTPGGLYVSSDSGSTWTRKLGTANQNWLTISVSEDGEHMIAASSLSGIYIGRIYISSDYGATWAEQGPTIGTNQYWMTASISGDGSYVIVQSYTGRMYYSYWPYILSLSCFASPSAPVAGQDVAWVASPTGGEWPYTFNWAGDDALSGTTFSPIKAYTSAGTKNATVRVTDANGDSITASCSTIVTGASLTLQSINWSGVSGDTYSNPRVNFGDGDQVSYSDNTTAEKWCKTVSGKNYTGGTTTPAGNNPVTSDRYRWNGAVWSDAGASSAYPLSYTCTKGTIIASATLVWSETAPAGLVGVNKRWHLIATNTNGSRVLAGNCGGRLYVSQDYGFSWTETRPAGNTDQNWIVAAMSGSGAKMIVGTYKAGTYKGRLYISQDYGSTWTETRPAGDTDQLWHTASVSSDGSLMIAGNNRGRIYKSTDGTNWTEIRPAGDKNGYWLSSSAGTDGTHLLAASYKGLATYANGIYISTNGGTTWTNVQPANDPTKNWVAAASSDNVHMVAASNGGRLYVSSNSGSTWTEVKPAGDANQNWVTVYASLDGTRMMAASSTLAGYQGKMYTSADSGSTWAETNPVQGSSNEAWTNVVVSGDGSYIATQSGNSIIGATTYKGRLYYSRVSN